MQITFDTTTITDDEVRGIFALLDTVRPEAFDPGPFDVTELETSIAEKVSTFTSEDGNFRIDPNTRTVSVATEAPAHDANGLVWDERIHSGSRALNADGTWRTKRGVDKALVAQVEAELRGSEETQEIVALGGAADPSQHDAEISEAAAQTVAPPAPPAPEAPPAPLAPAATESAPVETAPSAPVAPSSAVSPFVSLMKRVTTAQGSGKLTQPRVKELLESLDKKSIMDLRTDEDALASFAVLLDGEGV